MSCITGIRKRVIPDLALQGQLSLQGTFGVYMNVKVL